MTFRVPASRASDYGGAQDSAVFLVDLLGNAVGNSDNITLITAAGVTTSQNSADQSNAQYRGIKLYVNMTNVGTGSVTFTIQGKDPVTGTYYTILASAAIIANGFTAYTVYPGITATANVSASDVLPRTWRVLATANNANATTYTVSCSLEV